jgi:hypothetical protein
VTNKVFSIILSTFLEGLAAIQTSCEGSSASCKTSGSPTCELTEQLEVALDMAGQCLAKFKEPVNSIEDAEKKSCEAIRLLTKRYIRIVLHHLLLSLILRCRSSVRSIPRVSFYSGKKRILQVKMNREPCLGTLFIRNI